MRMRLLFAQNSAQGCSTSGREQRSPDVAGIAIESLPTDEELMIAHHVRQVLEAQRAAVREA
jgi:hypothetical protein